ncbi:outer membrane beta-barrel protein [Chryseobacterium sp. MHB01]|uniref:outer membrane beta-barrel protein n=1 Tax=Chryseobacterium sp. MHB01 TaxID=3109433 RepID=UPI002AFE27CB|nr:outer membrane beta-barrel protein [Chryseobacterium sp. MHB01]MEA1851022.1 outer membrane beta-barrel protein [Chryseobacterium sp. MHB01]
MRKILFTCLILIFGFSSAQVTFSTGIRTGVNFATLTKRNNENFYIHEDDKPEKVINTNLKTVTDFYIGLQGNIRFTERYALQPEFNYSRQGTNLQYTSENGILPRKRLHYDFVGLQFTNKVYIKNFNVFAGPFLDLAVGNNNAGLDLGFAGGLGYDLSKNLGFEVRIKKGFISMLDHENSSFLFANSNTVFQIGAYYTFRFKK